MTFKTICPICVNNLDEQSADKRYCTQDNLTFQCVDGIWRFLPPERAAYFAPFIADYETIRAAEGRGSQDSAWYRALPYAQPGTPFADDWRIRAKSYETLCKRVLTTSGLSIADVGAGNSWLSHRLTTAGHTVAAVDLLVNNADGLGAKCHYPVGFESYQAEFDRLPFAKSQFDYVIFNGVFHLLGGLSTHIERSAADTQARGRHRHHGHTRLSRCDQRPTDAQRTRSLLYRTLRQSIRPFANRRLLNL